MNKNAAFHGFANYRRWPIWLASLAASSTMLLICLAGSAAAQGPVGKDGQIHACYRVKGKPKGELRVVPSAKTHCRRGERKTTWSVASSPGNPVAGVGSQGAQGQSGANGSAGSEDAALKAQVGALTLKVQALEGVLQGITNGDLTGVLGTLQGLNNEGLTNAVNSLAATEALCEQSEALTEQVNLVAGVVEGLGLNGVLTGLGGLLVVPTLPTALAPFNCPTS
jgi:hypothetical protein